MKYKYTGDEEVFVHTVGRVQPGETIETDIEIDHPKFKVVKDTKKKEDKE